MRIGIFGGTFDPPHLAHIHLAQKASLVLELDRLLWVLTDKPPHKNEEPVTALDHRLDMVTEAIAQYSQFELSRVDIDRDPPHYAVDTLRLLRQQYPADELIYLMGGDSLRDLPTWHAPGQFVRACDGIGVVRRPGAEFDLEELESQISGITAKVQFVNMPLSEISATDIRRRVTQGMEFQQFLHPGVFQIIIDRQLYQSRNELKPSNVM